MCLKYLNGKFPLTPTAFTLLELLVVISIISMLMAITLPSLNRAREAGKGAVCLSNLRQLTIAWTAYATENNDKLCASDTEWNGIQPWDGLPSIANHFWVSDGPGVPYNDFCGTETAIKKGVLWPYLEILDVYKCKSEDDSFVRSYTISHAMGSIHIYNEERNFYHISEITMPSEKMVFIDVEPPCRLPCGDMGGVGGKASANPIDTFSKTWEGGLLHFTYRHNHACNMSFADGHVKHWKWKDERTMELMDGSYDPVKFENYSIDNPDIPRLLPLIRGDRDRQF